MREAPFRPRKLHLLSLLWLVLVSLGLYRSNHGGTNLFLVLGGAGLFASVAFQRSSHTATRVVFGILAFLLVMTILLTIFRHGLRF
ncbi:MAG TPA: hypothetical protein VE779_14230 [Candidatus Angelobacter sp.]|nr:hypothetical protein [Candidatus Angelobacter sp.]